MATPRAATSLLRVLKVTGGIGVAGYGLYVWRVQWRTPPPYVPRVMPRNDDLTKDVSKWRIVVRLFQLTIVLIPVVLLWPLFNRSDEARRRWYRLMKDVLESLGPAFIKLGQWSVTRRDMFPPDACEIFSELHHQVRCHHFSHTRKIIKKELGKEIEEIFDDFEEKPCGSGSIAQVHKARLKSTGEPVAVKVCHPNVKENIKVDFFCLKMIARMIHPFAKWYNFPGIADQFAENLSLQVDLRFEKYNGKIFYENFLECKSVQNPRPIDELVTERVKVETWVPGIPVSNYFIHAHDSKSTDHPAVPVLHRRLANIGVASFMQMVITDNWFHADLHPGNILVGFKDGDPNTPIVSLVDTGIVQTLTEDEYRVCNLLMNGVFRKEAKLCAEGCLRMGPNNDPVRNEAFRADMDELFKKLYPPKPKNFKYWLRFFRVLEKYEDLERKFGNYNQNVKTGKANALVQGLFNTVRKHGIIMEPTYVQLLVTAIMMEQVCNSIDPDCDVIFQCEPWLTAGFFGFRKKCP